MDISTDELVAGLKEHGYRARVVSLDRVALLQRQLSCLRNDGFFDEAFFQERLSWFKFQVPETLRNARSIIVAAMPRPQTRATFTVGGRRWPLIIPPTYTAYEQVQKRFEGVAAEILGKSGYAVVRTSLPLKQLAVRSGLAEYGKNNITYVSGIGSFLQIVAAYSDLPCRSDGWREPAMMKNCEGCDLCRRACLTGAIPEGRFLLRGERCIVYHNEKNGDIPFPEWMASSWHNCLIGCMHCQRACPQNKEFLKWVEGEEEFSEEETALILKGTPSDKISATTLEKLERLNIADDLDKLPRNLGVFFSRQSRHAS